MLMNAKKDFVAASIIPHLLHSNAAASVAAVARIQQASTTFKTAASLNNASGNTTISGSSCYSMAPRANVSPYFIPEKPGKFERRFSSPASSTLPVAPSFGPFRTWHIRNIRRGASFGGGATTASVPNSSGTVYGGGGVGVGASTEKESSVLGGGARSLEDGGVTSGSAGGDSSLVMAALHSPAVSPPPSDPSTPATIATQGNHSGRFTSSMDINGVQLMEYHLSAAAMALQEESTTSKPQPPSSQRVSALRAPKTSMPDASHRGPDMDSLFSMDEDVPQQVGLSLDEEDFAVNEAVLRSSLLSLSNYHHYPPSHPPPTSTNTSASTTATTAVTTRRQQQQEQHKQQDAPVLRRESLHRGASASANKPSANASSPSTTTTTSTSQSRPSHKASRKGSVASAAANRQQPGMTAHGVVATATTAATATARKSFPPSMNRGGIVASPPGVVSEKIASPSSGTLHPQQQQHQQHQQHHHHHHPKQAQHWTAASVAGPPPPTATTTSTTSATMTAALPFSAVGLKSTAAVHMSAGALLNAGSIPPRFVSRGFHSSNGASSTSSLSTHNGSLTDLHQPLHLGTASSGTGSVSTASIPGANGIATTQQPGGDSMPVVVTSVDIFDEWISLGME